MYLVGGLAGEGGDDPSEKVWHHGVLVVLRRFLFEIRFVF